MSSRGAAPGDGPRRPERDSRPLWRRWVVLGVALVALWLAGVATMAVLGGIAGRAGADRIREVELSAGVREFLDGEFDEDLDAALDHFERADRLLNNPIVAPARLLPIAGRQLRSAGAMAGTSTDILDASSRAAAALRRELDGGTPGGSERVAALDRLREHLRTVHEVLTDADLGPSDALLRPLQDARSELAGELTDARDRTGDLVVVLDAMHALLEGPSRYLVLAANNAEMRIGSGMFLSVGEVEVAEGRLSVTETFRPAAELVLDEPLSLPEEMEQLWGWSAMGADYRSLGMSARFPVNAELARAHWSELGGGEVDGVLGVDVVALRELLGVVGPVQLDDLTIDQGNVLAHLLQEQYREADDRDANAARRERLGDLASLVLQKLGSDTAHLPDLIDALQRARDGRHLMLWSPTPEAQEAWRQLGVDGELSANSVLVGLANVDGSKLDPHVEVSVDVQVTQRGDYVTHDLEIGIGNTAPGGMGRYVEGTDGSPDYRGLLVAHLPAVARDVSFVGFDGLSAFGPDGSTVVVAAPVAVQQGGQRVGRLRFTVPAGTEHHVVPSARVPAVAWVIGDETHLDHSEPALPTHGR